MASKKASDSTICRNRKASHKFEILEKMECGLVLNGSEVKSLRDGTGSMDEAFARIENDELWLIGFHIPPYSHSRGIDHDPLRRRKLLVHRSQLRKIKPKIEQKGLTMAALRVYFNERGIVKVTVALVRGKSRSDKRQSLRNRDDRREMDRAIKHRR